VLGALVLLCTGVPVVGRLQARRERRRDLQVPGEVSEVVGDVVGELRSVCGMRLRMLVSISPAAGGVHLPFIGQGEGELQACCTI
jgi:hypothetical protein